jgi:hypothetical protein
LLVAVLLVGHRRSGEVAVGRIHLNFATR